MGNQSDYTVTTAARALMDALKFTEEDLQANRAGKLSEAQRRVLAQRSLLMAGLALAGGIIFALAFGQLPEIGGQASLITFALMPIALAVLAFAGVELFGAFMKLQRNNISAARGNAQIEIDPAPR